MDLIRYMSIKGLTDAEFGKKCEPELTRIEVWRLKRKIRNPRADKVAAVEHGSRLRVTAKDLVPNQ